MKAKQSLFSILRGFAICNAKVKLDKNIDIPKAITTMPFSSEAMITGIETPNMKPAHSAVDILLNFSGVNFRFQFNAAIDGGF